MLAALLVTVATGVMTHIHFNEVVIFAVAGVGLALLATLVGHATEHLGAHLSPGVTGVLQATMGSLPELFIGVFSLRAGLVTVVQSALVGSILANSLLVLGLAFLFGGLKHGTQKFNRETPRLTITLSVLAVAALIIPTAAHQLHTPADKHGGALSVACAVLLLVVFATSLPAFLKGDDCAAQAGQARQEEAASEGNWPVWLAVAVLAVAALSAALVSDWFVEALTPAAKSLGLSEGFTGLVIVAIAGNAVENVVGVQFAIRNKMDYAVSIILTSSLQVALALTPLLVLLSFVVSRHHLTLVMPPLLVVALALTTIINAFIVYDGESNATEGVALIGLYGIIAAAFWWG